MIKKGVADQFEVEEYQKTEIIRKSVMDVKERAAEARERRTSPHKAYANVKSKVAGNLKSQKMAKKNSQRIAQNEQAHKDFLAGKNMAFVVGKHLESIYDREANSPARRSPTKSSTSPSKQGAAAYASPERNLEIQRKEQELASL